VVVTIDHMMPGETRASRGALPSVIVYFTPGVIDVAGKQRNVSAGEASFEPAQPRTLKNAGPMELKLVRVEFTGMGLGDTWGATGLSPNYKVVLENRFARVYDIRIPAGTKEPQHTHHDRVVICLSGAKLEHVMPDGRVEPSTLDTGEVVWRRGGTHIGHNLGKTNLWVIAVEPK
jgi:hypothetical protein